MVMAKKDIVGNIITAVSTTLILGSIYYAIDLKGLITTPPLQTIFRQEQAKRIINSNDIAFLKEQRIKDIKIINNAFLKNELSDKERLNEIKTLLSSTQSAVIKKLEEIQKEVIRFRIKSEKNGVKIENSEELLRELRGYRSYTPKRRK